MSFDSIYFWIIFLPSLPLYWLFTHKLQNIFLLFLSYFFYASWDPWFLSLLLVSTLIDYSMGKKAAPEFNLKTRRLAVAASLITNLGLLITFKYFNFFTDSFEVLLKQYGLEMNDWIKLTFPIGISFYTFQTISYTIDVYRERIKPTRDYISFSLYVAFFPQLVAGPIERARRLLPQMETKRIFSKNQCLAGLFLILWGLTKKVYFSSLLATTADHYYLSNEHGLIGWIISGFLMTCLVYNDFSGYSDIARGLAKTLGFDIIINFKPFLFAKNPSDFWNRWHRSLTFWIRDYLFVGVRVKTWGQIKKLSHVLVVFLLIGLWHDAHWAWVGFSLFHGLCIFGHQNLLKIGTKKLRQKLNILYDISGVFFMFSFFALSGFFHLIYIHGLPKYENYFLFTNIHIQNYLNLAWYLTPVFVPWLIYEYLQEKSGDYDFMLKAKPLWQGVFIGFCLACILVFERSAPQGFIYFDF